MTKLQRRKFFEIEIPLINEKVEASGSSIEELNNKTIKIDLARKLKGKSIDFIFKIIVENGKATAYPKKIVLLPSFMKYMMHKGISYVEDSFKTETKESEVIVKPFFITRKKVSRAIRRTLRNSAKNWIIDYLKEKYDDEVFEEILSNQMQKSLSIKLKKIYPLSVCEIRHFEVKKHLEKKLEEKEETKIGKEIEKKEDLEKEVKKEEINKEDKTSEKKKKKKSKEN